MLLASSSGGIPSSPFAGGGAAGPGSCGCAAARAGATLADDRLQPPDRMARPVSASNEVIAARSLNIALLTPSISAALTAPARTCLQPAAKSGLQQNRLERDAQARRRPAPMIPLRCVLVKKLY